MTRLGSAAEAFSATAARYARSMAPALVPAAEAVVRRAGIAPGATVLDVGTGTGTAAAIAARDAARVVGLDAAPGLLAIAREAHPEIEFVEADFADIPFADGEFDVVIGVHCVQFAADPEAVMAELRRVTRSGGRLSVSAPGPMELTPPGVFADIYARFGLETPPNGTTLEGLAGWARAGGWTDVEMQADPGFRVRLDGEEGVRDWLAAGPRGRTSAAWDDAKRNAFVAALIDASERDEAGGVFFPFGALYLTASAG